MFCSNPQVLQNPQQWSKKTLSVLPAFLFSRKQKSIQIFFKLVHKYTEQNLSIENVWDFGDTDGHFKNIKTLRAYFNTFFHQLDLILLSLNSQIIELKGDYEVENIAPGDDKINRKLKILFQMIDELVELLQQKKVTGIVLEDEKYYCFHWCLFHEAEIFLLKKCNSP